MKNNFFLIFCLMFLGMHVIAQSDSSLQSFTTEIKAIHQGNFEKLTPLQRMEDTLVYFADSMYTSQTPESKIEGSYAFIRTMKNMLTTKGSFEYEFPKLKENIAIIEAPDRSFRIYNWEVVRGTLERRYYGVIQLKDGSFIPLVDASDQIIRGGTDSVFTGTRWFGALYYKIIQKEIGGQPIYFLFGWNANQLNSERKIIEVFGFNSKGQHMFGAPMFAVTEKGKYKQLNRYMLEYQKGAKVSLNYDAENDQIIFDHCESQIGDPAKKYTYIPDGTYDGMKWDGQSWRLFENIIQINELQNGNAPVEKPIK